MVDVSFLPLFFLLAAQICGRSASRGDVIKTVGHVLHKPTHSFTNRDVSAVNAETGDADLQTVGSHRCEGGGHVKLFIAA